MLIRIILENFLSFSKAQEFNMLPNPKRATEKHHVYTSYSFPLLKQAAIYGNNASGKSNLIRGIDFIRQFALNEKFLSQQSIDRFRHRLDIEMQHKDIEVLVEFEVNGRVFIYDTALSEQGVVREDLYLRHPNQQPTLLYHRSLGTVELGGELEVEQKEQWKHTKDIVTKMLENSHRYASLLSLLQQFPVLKSADIDGVQHWFNKKLVIVGIHSVFPQLIELLYSRNDVLEFVNKVFGELAIEVDQVNVKSTDAEEWMLQHADDFHLDEMPDVKEGFVSAYDSSHRPLITAVIKDGQKKIQELVFQHTVNQDKFSMRAKDQSGGTLRILMLLPAIYSAVTSDKVVVIDEINQCLHPILLFDLIRFFANSDTKGQLIFSTHETELMEKNMLLRPDEIWMVNKKNGSSELYSANEFKLHNTISIRRGYREGRFGGTYRGSIKSYED